MISNQHIGTSPHQHIITSTAMNKSNFLPKNDLNLYLTENYFNVFGYIELHEDPMCINLINPLLFFNLLWQYHFTILSNKEKPLKILKRLNCVKLNSPQRCYLFHRLLLSFNSVCFFSKNENHNDPELISCLELIKCERDKLYKELYPDETVKDYSFDFEYVRKNLAFITHDEDKKAYLHLVILEYQQCLKPRVKEDPSLPNYKPFDKKCSLLLESIEKIHPEHGLPNNAVPVNSVVPGNARKESIRKCVNDHLTAIDPLKWEYLCESKSDFLVVVDILTEFFAEKKVSAGMDIQMREGCTTNLCHTLNTIYHELCPRTLKNNKDFYNVLKNLSIFKNKSNISIYNILKS